MREDYSETGDAWSYLPHDHARSRAYRWGEDGLSGISDHWQHLCFALALWNGRDPILKERLYGLTNAEGNHGEDVKEYWWALDSTPTHSWMQMVYRYPQAAFPYEALRVENARRDRHQPEFELIDTGVLDDGRFFDVTVTYAKAAPNEMLIVIEAANQGPDSAPLHVLPTLWFRNTWAWGRDDRHPHLCAMAPKSTDKCRVVAAEHLTLGRYWLAAEGTPELLFCDNETNLSRLYGVANPSPWVKDGINEHVVSGAATVNPQLEGTKASVWYKVEVPAGGSSCVRLRLGQAAPSPEAFDSRFDTTLEERRHEADLFFADLAPPGTPPEARRVQRRAMAGLLWGKKHYRYNVRQWAEGDPSHPPPPAARQAGRNHSWGHLHNADILSMPDEWEYPWYAAWDLAFHTVPLALVDPDFAKDQLTLLCREWYMHPDGQLPAYEWALGDVNPPVHAWAAWRVYKIDARKCGRRDLQFLARVFHKLLLNFSWWVNRKDQRGSNLFEGGFLGLDNIGLFDRSAPLVAGSRLEQSDATSWMAMFCLNMLAISLELACADRAYEDVATKFFEHFLAIAHASTYRGDVNLWDEADGFFYDILHTDGTDRSLRVRSLVGLIPLLAVETIEAEVFDRLPDFAARTRWFVKNRPDICARVFRYDEPGQDQRRLLSLVQPGQLRRVLARMLDEAEFLSPNGIRSLSAAHARPVHLNLGDVEYQIDYQPGESKSPMFGGNSNWRGPVWMPLNFLLIEALQKYEHYFGRAMEVDLPTGSGRAVDLGTVADDLSLRLVGLFLPGADGSRPVNGGDRRLDHDPLWREHVSFFEYFHGDTGQGLGASHQTGWTALVVKLIRQLGPKVSVASGCTTSPGRAEAW